MMKGLIVTILIITMWVAVTAWINWKGLHGGDVVGWFTVMIVITIGTCSMFEKKSKPGSGL